MFPHAERKIAVMRAARRARGKSRTRRGATLVEFAIIGPLVFLLLIGFAVLAMGVFRYQEVAYLARQGARHASIHGAQYRIDNQLPPGNQATWTDEIRTQAVLPHIASLDANRLTVAAAWSAGDNRANAGNSSNGFASTIPNAVTVTVTYSWMPEAYLVGPFQLQSSATMPMSY